MRPSKSVTYSRYIKIIIELGQLQRPPGWGKKKICKTILKTSKTKKKVYCKSFLQGSYIATPRMVKDKKCRHDIFLPFLGLVRPNTRKKIQGYLCSTSRSIKNMSKKTIIKKCFFFQL